MIAPPASAPPPQTGSGHRRRPSGARLLPLAVALALLAPARAGHAEVVDRIAAVVNDEIVTLRELRRFAGPGLASLDGIGNPELRQREEQRVLQSALDEIIGQLLLVQEAHQLRVTLEPGQVDKYLAGVKQQYGWDDAAMTEALRSEGSSVMEFRRDIERRMLSSRIIQMKLGPSVRISEEEVTEALQREYSGLARQEERTARHILLLVPEGATEEVESAVRQRAAAVLEAARAPGADFAALARERSEGPSAPKGGELGSFTEGMLDPVFEKAAFAAEVGEVVGPVRSRYGFHVLQVTRARMLAPKDEAVLRREAHSRLRQQALERAMKRWVAELKRKAFIDDKLFTKP